MAFYKRPPTCAALQATFDEADVVQAAAQRLLDAAFRGVFEEVLHWVEADVPGAAEWWGHSPLHIAAQKGDAEAARALLAAGASGLGPDALDKRGYTALHVASASGHAEVVEVLLAGGVDVGAPSLEGTTPIHCAAVMGHAHVVSMLVAAGADVRAVNQAGDSPLHGAARWGQLEVVRVLSEAGAPVGAFNPTTGRTAAQEAASKSHVEVAEFLLRSTGHE
jgi:ankyrin repeat protein